MPRAELRIADEFVDALAEIYSDRALARIRRAVENLALFPEMGSPLARPSLVAQFGEGIRHVCVSTFYLVYRFDGSTVDVLALVYGPSVV